MKTTPILVCLCTISMYILWRQVISILCLQGISIIMFTMFNNMWQLRLVSNNSPVYDFTLSKQKLCTDSHYFQWSNRSVMTLVTQHKWNQMKVLPKHKALSQSYFCKLCKYGNLGPTPLNSSDGLLVIPQILPCKVVLFVSLRNKYNKCTKERTAVPKSKVGITLSCIYTFT